ncbi:MAG TPA: glycosyl hydrolase [Candidatus Krumholzibacteria bacterium]|nr:glycosyl hydrolase [Candidatus Krumholzibacteria bacterium]
MLRRRLTLLTACAALVVASATASAADKDARTIGTRDLGALTWRSIGPCNMGGRATAIALVPGDPSAFYVGFATGGLYKSANGGVTFQDVFRDHETSSIGAVGVVNAPAAWAGWDTLAARGDTVAVDDRAERGRGLVVWVGTGEGNGRNSVSWGHGVYRSTDGGGSFTNVGLEQTHNIPALAVDPNDPERCFVAAMGHLWGSNPERGVFRTTDGGATWKQVLKVDDEVGACDVVIAPDDPQRVYAALYRARRTPWSFEGTTDRGGIWRSDDGGDTWTRLTEGLPTRTGRIGLAIAASRPSTLYACVESDQGGIGRDMFDDRSPAGGLFRSDDGGSTWRRVNDLNFRPFYFSRLAVDPTDPEHVYMPGWVVAVSSDGGRTFRATSQEVHVDHHAIVIDPANPKRILVGNDGGLYMSLDAGETWDYVDHLPLGQFYHVAVDMSEPYRVGGGLQDNGTWIGPSATSFRSGGDNGAGILNSDWRIVFGGDGFGLAFAPDDPNVVYATSQAGHLGRVHLDTQLIAPLRPASDEGQERVRFNWDTPFLVSHHDPSVLYQGGHRVYKLTGRGDYWYAISGDLTRRHVDRIMTEGSAAEAFGTITALAESPLTAGVLWAGTDDGRVHVTEDDGGQWKDVTPKPVKERYIACLEASPSDQATAYCAVDGHRTDDFAPLILMTTDGGRKWTDITGDLPAGSPVRVVREDPANPEVLYCGTETGAYASVDRGAHWLRLGGKSMPTVPVYDLVVHPREHDLVAATHGRSLWIMDDVLPLAEAPAAADKPLQVFRIKDATPRVYGFRGYGSGNRVFRGANPPDGAVVSFWLRDLPEGPVAVSIADSTGQVIRTLSSPGRAGLNRVVWDLQADEQHRFADPRRASPVFVEPMTYTVTVAVDGLSAKADVVVRPYPGWQPAEHRTELPPAVPDLSDD